MPNGALQEMFKTLQILFINYIKFVPYILARPSAGLNVFGKVLSLQHCLILIGAIRELEATTTTTAFKTSL